MALFGFGKPDIGRMERQKDIAGLIKALGYKEDPDTTVRKSASCALVRLGSESIPVLNAALKDPDPRVRKWTVVTLQDLHKSGKVVTVKSVDSLFAPLRDPDPEVRKYAAAALGATRDLNAVDPLFAALMDSDLEVRRLATDALGAIGTKKAEYPLIAALKNSDPETRKRAAIALGHYGYDNAVDQLIVALKDSEPEVRYSAADALGAIINFRATEPLIAMLKDPDPEMRKRSALALGLRGDRNLALQPLTAALGDTDPEVRRHAGIALEFIRAKGIITVQENTRMPALSREIVEEYAGALTTVKKLFFLNPTTIYYIDIFLNSIYSFTNYQALVMELKLFLDVELAIYEAYGDKKINQEDFLKLGVATGNQIKNIIDLLDDSELKRNWAIYADNPRDVTSMRNMYERANQIENNK